MWSHDPTPTEILGVELAGDHAERRRLERRVRRMTVTVAWLRQYAIEHRAEPIVRPKYVRHAIADFEAQIATMDARLRDLAPRLRSTLVEQRTGSR
jgi:hypothetical protein